jgi:hypothetical protein
MCSQVLDRRSKGEDVAWQQEQGQFSGQYLTLAPTPPDLLEDAPSSVAQYFWNYRLVR